ncbi:MAG TPA: hypothetical protein DD451_01280 [Candidatus Moranbacteria bacterium]|nr:hypothetical protein [Candidatus Moranbacteria bacterium]
MKVLGEMFESCQQKERVGVALAYSVGFAHCAKNFTGSSDLAFSIAIDVHKDSFISEMLKIFGKYLNSDEFEKCTSRFVEITRN